MTAIASFSLEKEADNSNEGDESSTLAVARGALPRALALRLLDGLFAPPQAEQQTEIAAVANWAVCSQ